MDNTAASTYVGTLGATATLTPFDTLTGSSAATDLLQVSGSTAGGELLPSGLTMTGVEKVNLITSTNAGQGTSLRFDTSIFTDVTQLVIQSAGTTGDFVKAAATTSVTDSSANSGINVSGGKDVTLTAKGAITASGAVGAVSATQTSNTAVAVTINGGTNVSVTSAGTSGVSVGVTTVPTGTVSVVESATGTVSVQGGTAVTVSANGGNVTVGDATKPTGAVTVTQSVSSGTVATNGGNGVTVTTVGGNVTVGTATTGVTGGAVAITNNSAGPNNDTATVVGGTAVNVTTTKTTGTISVGVAGAVATAGTSLTNAANSPTGDVTIVNKSTINGSASYGTAATTNVYTNGATKVSVTGAGTTTIGDIQAATQTSGANVGKAIGTSTLATVNLERAGTTGITSDALTAVNITGMSSTVTAYVAGAHTLAVGLSATSGTPTIVDATATGLTFTTSGGYATSTATSDPITFTAAKASTLAFNNAQNVVVGATTNAGAANTLGSSSTVTSTSVTASGSGTLNLGTTSGWTGSAKLASIDASGATGAVTATINGNVTAFTGGAGNDVLTVNTGISKGLNGGTGANTLVLDGLASTFNPALSPSGAILANSLISNFQTIGLSSNGNGTYNVAGATGLTTGALAGQVTFSNVGAGTTLGMTATDTNGVIYTLADATGTTDSLTVNIGGSAIVDDSTGGVTANGIETVTVNSTTSSTSTSPNKLKVTDAPTSGKVVYNIGGTAALTLSTAADNNAKTINVTNTAAVNVTGVSLSTTGTISISGGAGALTATGTTGTAANETITTGAGGGVLTIGAGGKVYGTGTGSETINLAASTAKSDNITTADTNVATIGGFTLTGSGTTSDVLSLGGTKQVLTDVTSASPTNTTGLTYTMVNGVITFSAETGYTLAQFSTLNQLGEAALIVNGGNNKVAAALIGGNTYVIASGTATTASASAALAASSITNLVGVSGVTGFATTTATTTSGAVAAAATAGTILLKGSGAASDLQSLAGTATVGTTTTGILAAGGAGYFAISGNAAADKSANIYTRTGLAQSATIDITGNTGAANNTNKQGAIVTTQTNTVGTNSLSVLFSDTSASKNQYVNTLTATGATTVSIAASAATGGTKTLASLVDGGTTNTLANVVISGGGDFVLGGVTSTALATIDASSATGAVNITAPAQTGVTIKAVTATGSTTISADGNGTVITQASSTTAGVTVASANGVGDSITLSNASNTITAANGNGTSITLGYGANTITAANGDGAVITIGSSLYASGGVTITSATGAGASITIKSASTTNTLAVTASGNGDLIDLSLYTTGAITANSTVTALGTGNTVKLGTGTDATHLLNVVVGTNANATFYGGYAQLDVSNATAGTTSSGSYKLTTVNTVLSTDKIKLVDKGTEVFNASPVDVSSATSVGAALDLAAVAGDGTNGNISWFQYGGNTYLVEDNSASTSLASGDVIVKFVGAVDLSELAGNGTNVLTF